MCSLSISSSDPQNREHNKGTVVQCPFCKYDLQANKFSSRRSTGDGHSQYYFPPHRSNPGRDLNESYKQGESEFNSESNVRSELYSRVEFAIEYCLPLSCQAPGWRFLRSGVQGVGCQWHG